MIIQVLTTFIVLHIACNQHQWQHQKKLFLFKVFLIDYLLLLLVLHASVQSNQKNAYANQIAYIVEIGELEIERGLKQISALLRTRDTRQGFHLRLISSLVKIFSPTCEILLKIIKEGNTTSQQEVAYLCYHAMISFEFVFILHLMKEIMEIIDALCQALQCQSQDILNAMYFVSFTKALIQKFRDDKM